MAKKREKPIQKINFPGIDFVGEDQEGAQLYKVTSHKTPVRVITITPETKDILAAIENKKNYTADALLQTAQSYFAWCDNNPFVDIDYVGKDGKSVERVRRRPYTIQGFCNHAYIDDPMLVYYEKSPEHNSVVRYIKRTIQQNQLEGATAGHFNGPIVSKLLGLIDKSESVNLNVNAAIDTNSLRAIADYFRELPVNIDIREDTCHTLPPAPPEG